MEVGKIRGSDGKLCESVEVVSRDNTTCYDGKQDLMVEQDSVCFYVRWLEDNRQHVDVWPVANVTTVQIVKAATSEDQDRGGGS